MTHRRYERLFMRITERFQLNPSGWIPHLTPLGLYEIGYSLETVREAFDKDGKWRWMDATPVHIPCHSIYSAFETICRERARKRLNLKDDESWVGKKLGFWYELWGFLSEVEMGIFDTTNWIPVDRPKEELEGD